MFLLLFTFNRVSHACAPRFIALSGEELGQVPCLIKPRESFSRIKPIWRFNLPTFHSLLLMSTLPKVGVVFDYSKEVSL